MYQLFTKHQLFSKYHLFTKHQSLMASVVHVLLLSYLAPMWDLESGEVFMDKSLELLRLPLLVNLVLLLLLPLPLVLIWDPESDLEVLSEANPQAILIFP
jgi:hypothetical protein